MPKLDRSQIIDFWARRELCDKVMELKEMIFC